MKNKWLATPYIGWAVGFIIIPLFLIVYFAFTKQVNGQIVFTFDHFAMFFAAENPNGVGLRRYPYVYITLKSIVVALVSTVVCFLLGYPVAYILATKEYIKKSTLLFLFAVPMWMNFLLRTYAWLTILERNGFLNTVLSFWNLPKITLLYTDYAVLLGMVYNFLPFMILPIYTVLKKIDVSLIEAAQDLGGNFFIVFFKVLLPLSIPGVISGVTMVFMPAVTTFVISNLLGGGEYILIGNMIERQFITLNDWNFGSAISLILMGIVMLVMTVFSSVDKNEEGSALL